MGLISYKFDQDGIILRVLILDSSSTTGAGLTGAAYNSSGLTITDIADVEAVASCGYYSTADSTIETITTLGTYAAPTSTVSNNVGYKARFKELSSTYFPGVYEIHLANTRYAVSNAKYLLVCIKGVTNMVPTYALIPLTQVDPYDAVRGGMTALPNAVAGNSSGLPINGSAWTPASFQSDTFDADTLTIANGMSIAGYPVAVTPVANSSGVVQTDSSGYIKVSNGTGTGQISLSSGIPAVNVTKINGTNAASTSGKFWVLATDGTSLSSSSGAGTGARSVTPTVNDGTDPIENAIVRFTEGVNTYTSTTDASGVCDPAFSLDDATYTVTISKPGYSFAPTTQVVDGTESPTYSMTAVTISAPDDPGLCRCYTYTKDRNGAVAGSVTVLYQIVSGPGMAGLSHPVTSGSVTSDAVTGKAEFDVYKGSTIKIKRGVSGEWSDDIAVGSGSTKALPELLGAP